jgi:fructokinase
MHGSQTFGYITLTPKLAWRNYDFAGAVARILDVPVAFDTDVNAAALAERALAAAQDVQDFIYLTVGAGIGGGAVVNGRLVHGLMHPEMGPSACLTIRPSGRERVIRPNKESQQ